MGGNAYSSRMSNSLTIEEKTVFGRLQQEGKLDVASEEEQFNTLSNARLFLQDAGCQIIAANPLPPRINGSRVRREPPVRRTGAFQTSKCECTP